MRIRLSILALTFKKLSVRGSSIRSLHGARVAFPNFAPLTWKDGLVAGGHRRPLSSSAVHKFIQFNAHLIGCVTGEGDDCAKLPMDSPQEVKSGTAADVVRILSSCNVKDLLIAGWDDTGPSLYRLDGEGKLIWGVILACGSCSEFGYGVVGAWSFPYMSIPAAAQLARVGIATALAKSKFYHEGNGSGSDESGDEANESGKVGVYVEVHCIGPDGYQKVDDTDEEVADGSREAETRAQKA
ncbi:OLC1v1038558C1 [Oldenlandia corymbosa var. corymbosa]|uniref:OLC1v1038558C1 n=1 Tax=Oldenlandia corymbosa var. corymbosa TaxID=529605 RepID=A0AAV1D2S8_OLDCO|nr:OLC1v1038558C1 [Oldenlandia corymbosa var. corymbosa]